MQITGIDPSQLDRVRRDLELARRTHAVEMGRAWMERNRSLFKRKQAACIKPSAPLPPSD